MLSKYPGQYRTVVKYVMWCLHVKQFLKLSTAHPGLGARPAAHRGGHHPPAAIAPLPPPPPRPRHARSAAGHPGGWPLHAPGRRRRGPAAEHPDCFVSFCSCSVTGSSGSPAAPSAAAGLDRDMPSLWRTGEGVAWRLGPRTQQKCVVCAADF